jgi:two-component system phosphate regulon sensor histidine kinase PhoR
MLYVAKALSPGGVVLRMAAGSATLENFRHAALRASLLILFLFCLAAAVMSFWISRWVSRPLLRLQGEARDVSRPLRWEAPFREAEILNQAFAEYADAVGKLSSGLQRERDRLRAVLDRLEEGVLLLDRRGAIRAANPSALRLLPIRPDATPLEGKSFARAVAHEGLCQWVTDSNPRRLPVLQLDRNPENPFDLVCHLRPLQPGDPDGDALLTVMDVTSFRNLDRAKTDFVANASHELKTPLSSILGYTEALFDGAMNDPKMLEHFLRKVHDNALRLQSLVKDLLCLSQLENQGPARAEPLPVGGFILSAWNQHRVEAERNGVRFENRVPESLIWNLEPRDLELLLGNLIGNAVRYNRPGGKVQIEWDGKARILEVRDTGQGIPTEMLPHIFERFYRGDPSRARGDGTGLGLAIVKHTAQRYGIQVSSESTVGEGSRFSLEVPAERIGPPA